MNQANRWLIGTVSAALLSGAALWEGVRYTPYKDIVGVTTVCYGETKNVENRKYSPEECKRMLKTELAEYGRGVLNCVNVPLTQNQYDAFTLFAYNVGVSGFCNSRANKLLNERKYEAACTALAFGPKGEPVWSYAGGKFVQGLQNRRVYEMKLCLGNKYSNTPS